MEVINKCNAVIVQKWLKNLSKYRAAYALNKLRSTYENVSEDEQGLLAHQVHVFTYLTMDLSKELSQPLKERYLENNTEVDKDLLKKEEAELKEEVKKLFKQEELRILKNEDSLYFLELSESKGLHENELNQIASDQKTGGH